MGAKVIRLEPEIKLIVSMKPKSVGAPEVWKYHVATCRTNYIQPLCDANK